MNCTDASGQRYYEVDYLAQEKVLKETHYTDDAARDSAYNQDPYSDSLSSIPNAEVDTVIALSSSG